MAGSKGTKSNKKTRNSGSASPERECAEIAAGRIAGDNEKNCLLIGMSVIDGKDGYLLHELEISNISADSTSANTVSLEDGATSATPLLLLKQADYEQGGLLHDSLGDTGNSGDNLVCSAGGVADTSCGNCVHNRGNANMPHDIDTSEQSMAHAFGMYKVNSGKDADGTLERGGAALLDCTAPPIVNSMAAQATRVSFKEVLTSKNILSNGAATSYVKPAVIDVKARASSMVDYVDNNEIVERSLSNVY